SFAGGRWLIGYRAGRRLQAIVTRTLDTHPKRRDLAREPLVRALEREFAAMFVKDGRPVEPKWVDRMVNRAVRSASTEHVAITHYIRCVFLSPPIPSAFTVGDVRFVSTKRFLKTYEKQIFAENSARAKSRSHKRADDKQGTGHLGASALSPEESARLGERML